MQSQLFWKDCEIFDDELNLVAQNTSRTYDSVIFDMAVYDMDKVIEEAGFLKQQGVLSTNSSIILIAEDKDDDTALQSSMKLLSDSLTGDCRVNAVVYKMESLNLFPKILDSPEWLEKKISMKNSSDMIRPFFISKTIEKLVSMDLLAVNSTIVHISDIINEFM